MQVRNQSYLRRKNKNSILEILRTKIQSYSDIARELKLSNTAVSKIVDDLIEQDLVYRESDAKGRTGINLSINENYGYIVAIDLSRWQIVISAANFSSEILETVYLEGINFRKSDLELIVNAVRMITESKKLKGLKLRCISIATPGKIDKESGEFILNPRFRELGAISLKTLFEKEFGCLVVLKNDINLALAAEKTYGQTLSETVNALMLHIDVGVGAALLIDGKVYEGSHGFAGEIGYFKVNMLLDENNYGNLNFGNYFDSTSLFSSLSIIKRELSLGRKSVISDWLKKRGQSWDDATIADMIKAYNENDELTVTVLHSAARVIGNFAVCIAELLDVDAIILNGSVSEFGERYLNYISAFTKEYRVVYSELKEKAPTMGAINAGILSVYDKIL